LAKYPCGLVHKHRMKGNEVPQVQRQSKAEPGRTRAGPVKFLGRGFSWVVGVGAQPLRNMHRMKQNECPRCSCNASSPGAQPGADPVNCLGRGLSWAVGVGAQPLCNLSINHRMKQNECPRCSCNASSPGAQQLAGPVNCIGLGLSCAVSVGAQPIVELHISIE